MMSLTAFSGSAAAAPGLPPGAFVDANRNLVYDAGELQFTTIQAAIDAAPAGGQVVVTPGSYTEQLLIQKSLTLCSSPALVKPVVICPAVLTGDSAILVIDATGQTINVQGLEFDGPGPLAGIFNGAIMVKNDAMANIVGNVFRNIYSPFEPASNHSYAINVGHSRAGGMWVSTAQARVFNNTFLTCYPGAVCVSGFGSILNYDTNDFFGRGAGLTYDTLAQWGVAAIDEAQAIITYSSFTGIDSVGGGGAVLAFNGADVDINNNVIAGVSDPLDTSVGMWLQGTGLIASIGTGTLNLVSAAIDSNAISGQATGIYFLLSRQDPMALTSPPSITNNLLTGNTVEGLKLEAVDNLTASYNTITGNGLHGIWVSTLYADNLVQDNNIYGNGVGIMSTSNGLHNFTPLNVVDAAYNYWGSPTGPAGEWLGTGDGVSLGVLYDPWYTAPVVGGSPISATGSRSIVTVAGSGTFSSAPAALNLTIWGSGTYTVTAMLFNGAPAQGMAKPLNRYYHFRLDTIVGLSEVWVSAKYATVPGSMNAEALRLYYYDIDHWEMFTATSVDTANKTVIGQIPTSSISPSLSMLTGDFLIAIGQPSITLAPVHGPAGTSIVVRGAGFKPDSLVQVTFDSSVVGFDYANYLGVLAPVTFNAPSIAPGIYQIRAIDESMAFATGTFNLLDVTPLVVSISTYATYYPHEVVNWNFNVTMNGVLTDADTVLVSLVTPSGTIALTAATMRVGTGTYRTPYTFNGAIGDFTLLIEVRKGTTHQGDAGRMFNTSAVLPAGTALTSLGTSESTLEIQGNQRTFVRSQMAFALVGVDSTVATLSSALGSIVSTYTTVGVTIQSVSGTSVQLSSLVGSVTEAAARIHAAVYDYASGLILGWTDIGYFQTPWQSLSASVVSVSGPHAYVSCTLGPFRTGAGAVNATVLSIIGSNAQLSTDMNQLTEPASLVNATLGAVLETTAYIGTDLNTVTEDARLINARVTSILDHNVTISSTVGTKVIPSTMVSATVAGINGTSVNVTTTLNSLLVEASQIHGMILLVTGQNAQLYTSLNSITVPAANVSASLSSVSANVAVIDTTLGPVTQNASLISVRAVRVLANQTQLNSTVGSIWISYLSAGATLQSVNGSSVWITTSYGGIEEAASQINAHIAELSNWTAVISTTIGQVTQNVSTVNGHIAAFNGNVTTVGSDIGTIVVANDRVSARVSALNGNSATVTTIFGSMPGTVASRTENMANITTSAGSVSLDISSYDNAQDTLLIILLVIAIIIILLIVYFVMRRGKGKKPEAKEEKAKK
jgi:hypothetical protein